MKFGGGDRKKQPVIGRDKKEPIGVLRLSGAGSRGKLFHAKA